MTQVIESILEMQKTARGYLRAGETVGLVPTMGALHEGHISLVKAARAENDRVVASVFVNPIQFGPNEDYSRYPRTFENDLRMLSEAGCDILFFPHVDEMYPEGFETQVSLSKLPNHLCGLSRPGHFDGVTTVVSKFFNIVRPDRAYFGEKDFQQVRVLERMNRDLNFGIEIRTMPIYRETDGLAMSSRNRYLSAEDRKRALALSKALSAAEELIKKGERKGEAISEAMRKVILSEIPEARIDYAVAVDPETLDTLSTITTKAQLMLAVWVGQTRLIDNRGISLL